MGCCRIINSSQEAIEQLQESVSGPIRITAPEAFGCLYLAPIIQTFLHQYPKVRFDIVTSSDYESLVEGGFDLAIRIGQLEDSSLRAKRVCQTRLGLFASKQYFNGKSVPARPADLLQHNCLVYTGMPQHASWFLALGDSDASHVMGDVRSNSEMFLIELAKQGRGILLFPELLLQRHIESKELEQVMPDYVSSIDIHAVYPFNRPPAQKLRLFIDFLSQSLCSS